MEFLGKHRGLSVSFEPAGSVGFMVRGSAFGLWGSWAQPRRNTKRFWGTYSGGANSTVSDSVKNLDELEAFRSLKPITPHDIYNEN